MDETVEGSGGGMGEVVMTRAGKKNGLRERTVSEEMRTAFVENIHTLVV